MRDDGMAARAVLTDYVVKRGEEVRTATRAALLLLIAFSRPLDS